MKLKSLVGFAFKEGKRLSRLISLLLSISSTTLRNIIPIFGCILKPKRKSILIILLFSNGSTLYSIVYGSSAYQYSGASVRSFSRVAEDRIHDSFLSVCDYRHSQVDQVGNEFGNAFIIAELHQLLK
jgi:hypothetical protein